MVLLKRSSWVAVALFLLLILAACGDTATPVAEQEGGFLFALPRITIDFNEEGEPAVAGVNPLLLRALTGGQLDLTQLRINPMYAKWFQETGVQHIELVHKDDGLFIFANGKPMPHIGWSGESLAAVGAIADQLGLLNERSALVLKILLPFAQRMGLDFVLRFPVKEGTEIIPLRDPSVPLKMSAEEPNKGMAQVRIHADYDEKGIPSILSVSTRDLEKALGANLRQWELSPSAVEGMVDAGIQHFMVRTTPEGLMIWVNGEALPYIVWSDEYLKNGAELYGQLYPWDQYAPYREAMKVLLPVLDDIDAELALRFPLAPNAESIPLPNP